MVVAIFSMYLSSLEEELYLKIQKNTQIKKIKQAYMDFI